MRRNILALVFAGALLVATAVPALAAESTIRVTGAGEQRACVVLPHTAGDGSQTAEDNSGGTIDRTHPADACP